MTIWDGIAWAMVAWWFWQLWPIWWGLFRVNSIGEIQPLLSTDPDLPLISIIVPARDEAAGVEEALRLLLSLDYPRYEIIAIDDRSQDGTGAIMDRVAGADPRCRVLHVTELPPGWLGKNHANMLGVAQSRGELLLFTDGDVKFAPDLLLRSVAAMRDHKLDHLVLVPDTLPANYWEAMIMNYFAFLFAISTRFPIARFRWARHAYIGLGAFNLVRRTAYEAIGGHTTLCMEVLDDVKLGKLIKRAGLAQEALMGSPYIAVKWQTGIWGIVRGLEKNAFASARYSIPSALSIILGQPTFTAGPLILVFTGPEQLQCGIMLAMTVASILVHAYLNGQRFGTVLCYPLAALLFSAIIARSMYITLRNGGVRWRDTFYPLADLRKGQV